MSTLITYVMIQLLLSHQRSKADVELILIMTSAFSNMNIATFIMVIIHRVLETRELNIRISRSAQGFVRQKRSNFEEREYKIIIELQFNSYLLVPFIYR